MLRPWLGLVSCAFGLVAILFEILVLSVYFMFLGLEVCGILTGLLCITHGLCGILTGKEDFSFQTRQSIYLLDYMTSVIFAFISFGMICATFFAVSVYVYIVMFLGSTGIAELMVLLGIPFTPLIALIVVKGFVLLVYLILFVISIAAAISNRRNRPE